MERSHGDGMLKSTEPGGSWADTSSERISPPPTALSSGSALCLEALAGLDRMSWASSLVPACARSGTDGSRSAPVIRLLQSESRCSRRGQPSHSQRRRCNGDCCSQRIPSHHLTPLQPRSRRRPDVGEEHGTHRPRAPACPSRARPTLGGRPSSRFAPKCPGQDSMHRCIPPADTLPVRHRRDKHTDPISPRCGALSLLKRRAGC